MTTSEQQRRAAQVRRLIETSLVFVIALILAVSLAGGLAAHARSSITCTAETFSGRVEGCGPSAADPVESRAAARVTFVSP